MLSLANTYVMNMENAFRGMRNPLSSWAKSDSKTENGRFIAGEQDLALAHRLCASGSDDRKFIRQIMISVDITAPIYWWKEFDTYKVGTVANSTSTMHRIHSKPFSLSDFSCERMNPQAAEALNGVIACLEELRQGYNQTKDKELWYSMIQLLPSGYNQMRTVTFNYENAVNIYRARKNHKLDEWRVLCAWIETLPYAEQLITFVANKEG